MAENISHLILLFFLFLSSEAAKFRIVNKCRHTVWPGLLSGATSPPLPTTGFSLQPGKSRTFNFPKSWSGRIWARTLCSTDPTTQKLVCLTGDCASGKLECGGAGAIPPATLAEFTLNGAGGLDFYDVSLVDGYNLPILVVPRGGKGGDCSPTGCLVDLNGACPKELSVEVARGNGSELVGKGTAVACKSACEAFGAPQFCCSEGFNTPDTCSPSIYSVYFKKACPRAYSYAYDDKTSTFTCGGADYIIVFCPPPYTSEKLLGKRKMAGELPLVNKKMMYLHSRGSKASAAGLAITQLITTTLFVLCCVSWDFILVF
ncbi:thaumatin-like protein 1b isoform X1 [Amaranthus tricolor]|uniref:thaumatin-like protein 1b isoform X1 n=1 Tax=Amaranthus tricolor TaxID=29722 RepID=UPI00258DCF78|nr:thaumatin-like protein 1b isoform X1 [Amaranthus tricolor]